MLKHGSLYGDFLKLKFGEKGTKNDLKFDEIQTNKNEILSIFPVLYLKKDIFFSKTFLRLNNMSFVELVKYSYLKKMATTIIFGVTIK